MSSSSLFSDFVFEQYSVVICVSISVSHFPLVF
jgi:hypothetical protein